MKNLILLFIIFFSAQVLSVDVNKMFNENVKVVKDSGKIFLVGKDCSVLNKEGGALAKWTKSVSERVIDNACACSRGVCKKEISSNLPKFAETYQFKHVPSEGPNCFNATLVASKIVPQVRYTSDSEMEFWMESPLCKERKAEESLSPGDIIVIKYGASTTIHGFTYISDNLSFSKNGADPSRPYSLQDPEVVFNTYSVAPECRRITKNTSSLCDIYASYYSCASMDDYLKENPIKESHTKEAYKQLNIYECQTSAFATSVGEEKELMSLVTDNLNTIMNLASDTLNNKSFDENDEVIWRAILYSASSLDDQIWMIKNPTPAAWYDDE